MNENLETFIADEAKRDRLKLALKLVLLKRSIEALAISAACARDEYQSGSDGNFALECLEKQTKSWLEMYWSELTGAELEKAIDEVIDGEVEAPEFLHV